MKLERKNGNKRIYGAAQTPLARVLQSPRVNTGEKEKLRQDKSRLNPFELKAQITKELKTIEKLRRLQRA